MSSAIFLCRRTAFNAAIAGWLPCGVLLAMVGFTLAKDEARMQERLAQKVEDRRLGQTESGIFLHT